MKLSRFATVSFLATALAAASSCSGEHSEDKRPGRARWTVLVYMAADNDLEPAALEDLLEMTQIGGADGVNILVQIDRHPKYSNAGVANLDNFDSTKRLRVERGSLRELADLGELNTGDAATLSGFIGWGIREGPADQYALILWDHGGGWTGFAVDESTRPRDRLNLAELRDGLRTGLATAGVERFSLIGFDACLMATYETATTVRPFASYLLASEELEPAHGWDYRSLKVLSEHKEATAVDLGISLLSGYETQAQSMKTADGVTLSLVDLAQLDALDAAMVAFASSADPMENVSDLARPQDTALKFGDSPDPRKARHLVDVGDLANKVAVHRPEKARVSSGVTSAISRAVIAKLAGRAKASSSGLSVYFPPSVRYYNGAYDAVSGGDAWRPKLKSFFDAAGLNMRAPKFVNAMHAPTVHVDELLTVSGTLSKETAPFVADATLFFGIVDPATADATFLGDVAADLDSGTEVSGLWDGSLLRVSQADVVGYGYFSSRDRARGTQEVTMPIAYRESPADEETDAELVIILDPEGREVSRNFYTWGEDAVGALSPAAGSTMRLLKLRHSATTDSEEWIEGAAVFDLRAPIELKLQKLAPATLVQVRLTVTDAAGRSDSLAATAKL